MSVDCHNQLCNHAGAPSSISSWSNLKLTNTSVVVWPIQNLLLKWWCHYYATYIIKSIMFCNIDVLMLPIQLLSNRQSPWFMTLYTEFSDCFCSGVSSYWNYFQAYQLFGLVTLNSHLNRMKNCNLNDQYSSGYESAFTTQLQYYVLWSFSGISSVFIHISISVFRCSAWVFKH